MERLSKIEESAESNADGPSDHSNATSTFRRHHLTEIVKGDGVYNLSGELQNGSGVLDEKEQAIRHNIANEVRKASVFTEPVKSISGTSLDSQFREASDEMVWSSKVDHPSLNDQTYKSE